jgi:hypothetical protein
MWMRLAIKPNAMRLDKTINSFAVITLIKLCNLPKKIASCWHKQIKNNTYIPLQNLYLYLYNKSMSMPKKYNAPHVMPCMAQRGDKTTPLFLKAPLPLLLLLICYDYDDDEHCTP